MVERDAEVMTPPGTKPKQQSEVQGSIVEIEDVVGAGVRIVIDGHPLRFIGGYQVNRLDMRGQPVLQVAIPVRRLNGKDSRILHPSMGIPPNKQQRQ